MFFDGASGPGKCFAGEVAGIQDNSRCDQTADKKRMG